MDERSKNKRRFDAVITAINIAAFGAGIAAVIAARKGKVATADAGKIEKTVSELSVKFDRISEQLKNIQPDASAPAKEVEKKPEGPHQTHGKPQDIIYVRKSSEFSFYN